MKDFSTQIPSPHEVNLLENIRAGYAVQSPQGARLFEEAEYKAAIEFCKEDCKRYIQPVMLAEQGEKTCQIPVPAGWTVHKEMDK